MIDGLTPKDSENKCGPVYQIRKTKLRDDELKNRKKHDDDDDNNAVADSDDMRTIEADDDNPNNDFKGNAT